MLQGIDIKEWVCVGQPKPLHAVERKSLCSFVDEPAIPFWFESLDGTYSYCNMLDGTVFHPAAWSEVFVWKKAC